MNGKWLGVAAAILAFGIVNTASAGGDVAAGKAKAKSCAACHGADGMGKKDNPPLAGMAADKFTQAMADYKSGKKDHKMMVKLAKKTSDEDVANMAAYYASLKK